MGNKVFEEYDVGGGEGRGRGIFRLKMDGTDEVERFEGY